MVTPVWSFAPRTIWTCDRLMSRKGMDGRRRVQFDHEAVLVSSLTETGAHAPCLDLDFDVMIGHRGELICTIPPEVNTIPRFFDSMAEVFAEAGLGTMRYFRQQSVLSDDGPRDLDDLTEIVAIYMASPYHLAPSSTEFHAHLYIDREIPWSTYEGVLRHMRDFGLIESGFADNSIEREMTMLIRPGLTKEDLLERGIVIEDYNATEPTEDDKETE